MDRRTIGIGIVIGVVLVLAYSQSHSLLSIIPGPEGPRAYFYALQTGGGMYKASIPDPLPANFRWVDNSPLNTVIAHDKEGSEPLGGYWLNGPDWWYNYGSGQLKIEVQQPTLQDDPIGFKTQTLTYYKYVPTADGTEIHKVVVNIMPADFVIQLSSVPGSGVYNWREITFWFMLDTVTWQNAYKTSPPPDPNPLTNSTVKYLASNYRGAFPIIMWIGEYKDPIMVSNTQTQKPLPPDEVLQCAQLNPDMTGRYIELYTAPGTGYTITTNRDVLTSPESALSPDIMPDPRFAETTYFKITVLRFGPYVEPTGILGSYSSYTEWYPAVYYRLRVVYAVSTEYVYLWTSSEAQQQGYSGWQVRESTPVVVTDPITAFFRGIADWLKNPWNAFGLGLFGTIAGILIILALIIIFAPWLLAILLGRRRED